MPLRPSFSDDGSISGSTSGSALVVGEHLPLSDYGMVSSESSPTPLVWASPTSLNSHNANSLRIRQWLIFESLDVEILYNIVSRAESEPDVQVLPFKAIFTAYDNVLSERGINRESDRVWLRYLFKVGDKSRDGTLFEKFEMLLGEMGIELAYDEDGRERRHEEVERDEESGRRKGMDGAGNEVSDVVTPTDARGLADFGTPTDISRRKRGRRASFNSLYDATATADSTRWSAKRPSSRSSVSRLQVGKSPFPNTREEGLQKPELGREPQLQTGLGKRNRVSEAGAPYRFSRPQRQEALQARQQALKEWRPAAAEKAAWTGDGRLPLGKSSGVLYDDSSLDAATSTTLGDDNLLRRVTVPSPQRIQSGDAQSLQHRSRQPGISPTSQHTSRPPHQKASHYDYIRQAQERRAVEHDRSSLLWDAFNRWLTLFRSKRRERIYDEVARRVVERRNLNTLHQTFDQWIIATSREYNRTALARRHMLRRKYFNLWRDFTARNELKVQLLGLQTPFDLWRKVYVRIWANEITAIQVYRENLAKRFFWQWFWAYCDSSAPKLYATKVEQKLFNAWQDAWAMTRKSMRLAEDQYEQSLKLSALRKWSNYRKGDLSMRYKADTFRKRILLRRCVSVWHKQARLSPLASRVSNMVDWRIARTTSATWILRTRMAKRAAEVDRIRALRNTWTAWNDRLRWQTLEARIDERLILQSLYKWALTSRFHLMKRIHERRVQRQTLQKLVVGYRKVETGFEQRENRVEETGNRHRAATHLDLLRVKMQALRQNEQLATDFYTPRIEQSSLEAWKAQYQRVQEMHARARDKEIFFLKRKTMECWREAVGEARRLKRREAYAHIRRTVKMNIASAAIEKWHSRMKQLRQTEDRAQSLYDDKVTIIAAKTLEQWRDRTSRFQQNLKTAEFHHNTLLVNQSLRAWAAVLQRIADLKARSDQFSHIHVLGLAAPLLRKLRFRIFEIHTRQEAADSMNDRNHKKHVRNMIRHWADRLLSGDPPNDPDFTRPVDITMQGDLGTFLGDGTPGRGGEWTTAFGEPFNTSDWIPALEAPSSSTPLTVPGYLNTPSKRAVRARALAQMSTTPATPVRTPFAARLRGQAESGRRTGATQHRGLGLRQSRLGVGRGIDDEETMGGEGDWRRHE
jgi:protein SFI1